MLSGNRILTIMMLLDRITIKLNWLLLRSEIMIQKMKNFFWKTPDELLRNIFEPFWKENNDVCKRVLWVSMLTCIFNYFYLIVNGYGGPDAICEGVWYFIGENTAYRNARWCVPLITSFFGKNVVIPLVIVVFYCLAIAASAFLIFKLLEITNIGFQIFIVSSMVSFPVITRQFAYLYMALAYAVSFFMVVLAAWFLRRKTILSFVCGTICLLIMMGAFQSYIGAAAALVLICFLLDVIKGRPIIEAIKDVGIYIFSGVLAGIFDLLIANVIINMRGIEASGRVASVSLSEAIKYLGFSVPMSYRWFFMYFDDDVLSRSKLYIVLFIILAILLVINIFLLVKNNKIVNSICLIIGFFLLPLAMNVCVVIFPHNGIYDVMRYQYVLVIPLVFAMLEMLPKTVWTSLLHWAIYANVFLLIMGYTISSNASAICYKLAYESTHDQAVSMLSRVYELEGYDMNTTPIVLGGQAISYQDTYDQFGQLFRYAVMESGPVFWGGEYGLTTCRYFYFLDYLGVNPQWLTNEQYHYVIKTQEYCEMPCWPEEGSVKMIDEYAVIKIVE